MPIKELAYHKTPLGDLTLRVRPEPLLKIDEVYEVKLGEEFLMSSLFTKAEEQLADLGLKNLKGELDVVVGGLGLGYTAAAALDNQHVGSLLVVDTFPEVVDWHEAGLVPLGTRLTEDDRCTFHVGDFFDLAQTGFDPSDENRKFDAILLDIDHTPEHFLDKKNASFYTADGLQALKNQLKSPGVFALWSDDPPDKNFRSHLEKVFGNSATHEIEFPNPYTGSVSVNSVYTATRSLS